MLTSSLLFSISFVLLTIHSVASSLPVAVLGELRPATQSVTYGHSKLAEYGYMQRTGLSVAVLDDHRGSGR